MSNPLKQFFLGGLSLTVVNISQKAVNFILLPIFTFYLSPKEFGLVAVYFLVIAFLSMLYNPGVISTATRLFYDVEKYSLESKEIIASSMAFLILTPTIVLVISVFFGDIIFNYFFKNIAFWPYGFLAVFSAIMTQPIRMWNTYYVILGKTKIIAILSIVQMLISVSFSLVFVIIYNLGALGRIYGLIIGNIVIFICAIYFVFNQAGFVISIKKLKYILRIGFPLTLGVVAYVILDISDRYMIEKFLGLEYLGKYDISYTISSIPLFIIIGFNQVWQPTFFENMLKENFALIKKIVFYFISTFSVIVSLVIIFSNEIFNIFINNSFHSGMVIVPWILLGIFFLGVTNFLNSILMFDKKFKQIGFISIIAAILNICINFILIPFLGILGAAIATFLSYFIYCLILIYYTKNKVFDLFSFKKLSFFVIYLFSTTFIIFFLNKSLPDFNLRITIIKITFSLLFLMFSVWMFFQTEYYYFKEQFIKRWQIK